MPTSILFSGHMIDMPDRPSPRFPPKLAFPAGRRIHAAIASFLHGDPSEPVLGFASGARGGDILFHEECRAQRIDTVIILPFSPEEFIRSSVELAESDPGDWRRRFRKLWDETPETRREIMDLPHNDRAYGLCNERLITRARAYGPVHLIALWDGQKGDGHGGTANMVAQADSNGTPDVISPRSLEPHP
ncbi:hypothetical protein [Rhizobium ruizarguesonis]|nr:hypothetical protein [Rhizobium ruizarguesonis]TBD93120.1 hypothetical protein ELH12_37780 [Rhizobium ruizarguesonis]